MPGRIFVIFARERSEGERSPLDGAVYDPVVETGGVFFDFLERTEIASGSNTVESYEIGAVSCSNVAACGPVVNTPCRYGF